MKCSIYSAEISFVLGLAFLGNKSLFSSADCVSSAKESLITNSILFNHQFENAEESQIAVRRME